MDVRTTERQRIVVCVGFRCTLTCACTLRVSSSTIFSSSVEARDAATATCARRVGGDPLSPRQRGGSPPARVAALASCTTPSVIFLFAVSTRRYPASCRTATSKRHKIERCRVFATPVSCGVRPRHLARLWSEASAPRANCDVRFRTDDRQILISASANFLQRRASL